MMKEFTSEQIQKYKNLVDDFYSQYPKQSQPSDYQLRLERYAMDILTTESNTYTVAGAFDMAALVIKAAAEKAREQWNAKGLNTATT